MNRPLRMALTAPSALTRALDGAPARALRVAAAGAFAVGMTISNPAAHAKTPSSLQAGSARSPAKAAGTLAGMRLPQEVRDMLEATSIDRSKITLFVQAVGHVPPQGPRAASDPSVLVSLNATQSFNPASLEKLYTTQAALDLLGPAWQWVTPVWLDGVRLPSSAQGHGSTPGDVLQGRLVIKGSGDPKLNVERTWLMLSRLRQLGIRSIQGDVVLDQSAFDIPEVHPGAFDNEPLRPYNVRPQALLLNQKSVLLQFVPEPSRGVALVSALPVLDGVSVDATVPLSNEACGDWRTRLASPWDDVTRTRFAGSLALACGEKTWPIAFADPATYHERLLRSLWASMGGTITGAVRETKTPRELGLPSDDPVDATNASSATPTSTSLTAKPAALRFESPPLAEVVRDINKYSNNTMAQQLFLTLSAQRKGTGTWEGSRDLVHQWLGQTVKAPTDGVVVDNGAGLSRLSRTTSLALAHVLQHAWRTPSMPDLLASLPASGIDGTLRRSLAGAGRAHLKTGSLRDVAAVAGYVLGDSGTRYVLVAIVNQEGASIEARRFFDTLVAWTADDAGLNSSARSPVNEKRRIYHRTTQRLKRR